MDDEDRRTLWCGNLAGKITDELLFELFLQAGPVERVCIPKDKDGRLRNYGFVTFKHEMSVPYAINLMDGTTLFGRTLSMKNRNITQQQSQLRQQSPAAHQQQRYGQQQSPALHQQQRHGQGHHRSLSTAAIPIDQMMLAQGAAANEINAFSTSILALQGMQTINFAQSNMVPQSRNSMQQQSYQQQHGYQQHNRHQDRSSPRQRSPHQDRSSHSRSQERSDSRSRERSYRDKHYQNRRY